MRAASRDAFAELSRNVPPTKTNKDGVDVLDLAGARAIVSTGPIKAKHEPSRVPVLSPPVRSFKELGPLVPSSPGLMIPHGTNREIEMSDWMVSWPSPTLEINSAIRGEQTIEFPTNALPSSSMSGFGEHLLEDVDELQALDDILCTRRLVEKRKNLEYRAASVPETDEHLLPWPREDATATTIAVSPSSGVALGDATSASQVNMNTGAKRVLEHQSGKAVSPTSTEIPSF